jgi:hypothetical protein
MEAAWSSETLVSYNNITIQKTLASNSDGCWNNCYINAERNVGMQSLSRGAESNICTTRLVTYWFSVMQNQNWTDLIDKNIILTVENRF